MKTSVITEACDLGIRLYNQSSTDLTSIMRKALYNFFIELDSRVANYDKLAIRYLLEVGDTEIEKALQEVEEAIEGTRKLLDLRLEYRNN